MSSEEKASNPNQGDDQSNFDAEPVEAELADTTPLAEQAGDFRDDELIEATVVDAHTADQSANDSETEKSGITSFFKEHDGVPDMTSVAMASAAGKIPLKVGSPPPLASNLQNLSANGGAIGALVLGVWCFAGSFITNWSISNGMLGLLLGAWGLTSRRKKTAWIGIALCTIGILLCLAQFSELVNQWWYEVDDTVG